MDSLNLLRTAASGMEAQRAALDVEARNIAAAEAAGPKGSYERLVPHFQLTDSDGVPEIAFDGAAPKHGSTVDVLTEMVSVLNASRAYESNAAIFEIGKQLAQRTIDMGRV
jgi:flagellar basal body rod protein FlgC